MKNTLPVVFGRLTFFVLVVAFLSPRVVRNGVRVGGGGDDGGGQEADRDAAEGEGALQGLFSSVCRGHKVRPLVSKGTVRKLSEEAGGK